jgi:polyribonucleotide nucleotidyltransferase
VRTPTPQAASRGFFKREGKPPEKEVLTSRLIDRPIRPLFPSGWRYETQVVALVISADTENDSDVLALTGAGAALAISEIPFAKPIAGVRIGLVDGTFLVNPTYDQRRKSRLDLIVAGTADAIVMVEAGAKEVSEDEMVIALDTAHKAIKDIIVGHRASAVSHKPKPKVSRDRPHFYREVETKVFGPLADAAHPGG